MSNGLVFKWWSENQTINVWFLNGPPNHMIRPLENWTKKCLKSQMFGFQVFSFQMVTVVGPFFECVPFSGVDFIKGFAP